MSDGSRPAARRPSTRLAAFSASPIGHRYRRRLGLARHAFGRRSRRPQSVRHALAHTAWLNAGLHDDDIAERDGLPDAAARARLLAAIVEGYGLPRGERGALVDRMVELAVLTAREDALEGLARGVEWRVRSAAWMLRHRPLLRRALGA